ncbi:MAG: hypothetical protein H6621_08120 [Halobacteriovoraceae bacterium]|nr:hypothetical protein [Halobacteriovoraceae bacterium]
MKWFAVLFGMLLISCGSIPYFSSLDAESLEMSADEYTDHINKGLVQWKLRHQRPQLESFIKHFEFCARSSKTYTSAILEPYKIYEMLARGYYFLANYHVDKFELKKEYYERGAYWAEKALYTNEKFKLAVGEYGEYIPALKFLRKKELGAIYWYLANIGKWAKNSGIATSLKYLKLIRSMLRRIVDFDPNFYYGSVYRYWGAYYAVIPTFAGGDLNKSKRYFLKSIKIGPDYLSTRVMYAENYALKNRDSKLFKSILKTVVDTKLDPNSEIYSENFMEAKRAQELLDNINELF